MRERVSLDRRSSGLLLHPISLPGPFGIGDFGPEAYRFADFLDSTHQTWWQMFPLGSPGIGDSPYQVLSAFAGNPLLISPEELVRTGLLSRADLRSCPALPARRVHYERAWRLKLPLFQKAFANFESRKLASKAPFQAFLKANSQWLTDFTIYSAIRHRYTGASWDSWEPELRDRNKAAIARARRELSDLVRFHEFVQFIFFEQWKNLQEYCMSRGIGLIGDVPIFVAHDSADVWAHREFFRLHPNGKPKFVAGTPPDYFSKTGQRWGNPLYRWDVMKRQGYEWWIQRIRHTFQLFDSVRLDHFIGFERYWEIPASDETAVNGKWVPGPSAHFFKSIIRRLGKLEFIAEDLGSLTQEVKDLRDQFNFPGMRVLQFAFGSDPEANNYLPHSYPRRCVVYTGTHDNDTTVGWFNDRGSKFSTRSRQQIEDERALTKLYLNSDGKEIHWDMIRSALMSVGDVAIFPVQDLLGLGSEARMNLPGTTKGNWEWRMSKGALSQKIGNRLAALTHAYGRRKRPFKK